MAITLDDFQVLQRKVDNLRRARDRAAGAYDQLLKELKEKFDCNDIKEADELLEKLRQEELDAYNKYIKRKERFEKEWEAVLDGLASD